MDQSRKIVIHPPDGKSFETNADLQYTIESFLHRLKIEERIHGSKLFELVDMNGNVINNGLLIRSLKTTEFKILEVKKDTPIPHDDIVKARLFHQLGVFILDGSASMLAPAEGGISKAQAVNQAMKEVIHSVKSSKNKNYFSIGAIKFDTTASKCFDVMACVDADELGSYDPTVGHGGETNLGCGIPLAMDWIEDHLSQQDEGGTPHSALIVLLSDGEDHQSSETLKMINELKQKYSPDKLKFCTTYFAQLGKSNSRATSHLKSIASDAERDYKECYSAGDLRGFFLDSISSAAGISI